MAVLPLFQPAPELLPLPEQPWSPPVVKESALRARTVAQALDPVYPEARRMSGCIEVAPEEGGRVIPCQASGPAPGLRGQGTHAAMTRVYIVELDSRSPIPIARPLVASRPRECAALPDLSGGHAVWLGWKRREPVAPHPKLQPPRRDCALGAINAPSSPSCCLGTTGMAAQRRSRLTRVAALRTPLGMRVRSRALHGLPHSAGQFMAYLTKPSARA